MSIYEYRPMMIFFIVLAAAFGAVMGSFLNCAAWRITHGESFIKGRSHCPACGHTLGVLELIPVFSWLFQKGRCKACGSVIPARYPLTELVFAGVTAVCLIRFDLTILCLRNYVFLCCLFVLFLTDMDDMIIPDGCHIAAIAAWILAEPFLFTGWGSTALSVGAAFLFGGGLLAVSLVMDRVLGRDSLGGGDIKLFFVVGLYLGMIGTLFTMMLACILGLVIHRIISGKEKKEFPFGPAIAVSTCIMLLFGDPVINWYSSLL